MVLVFFFFGENQKLQPCFVMIRSVNTLLIRLLITTPHRWVSQRGQMPTCPRYQIQAADRLLGFMVFRNLDEGSIYL